MKTYLICCLPHRPSDDELERCGPTRSVAHACRAVADGHDPAGGHMSSLPSASPAGSKAKYDACIGFRLTLALWSQSMRTCHRFLTLLVVLDLLLGTGRSTSVAAEMECSAQALKVIVHALASDPSMVGMCGRCGEKAPSSQRCFAGCVGIQAVLPVVGILRVSAKASLGPLVEWRFNGSSARPDLPPPRLTVSA
jgi:hypothetical protein